MKQKKDLGNGCFDKEVSLVMYGIAITAMVWEHLFFIEEKVKGITPLFRFSSGVTVEKILGDFISCVSLYVFISGYGLCKSAMKQWTIRPEYTKQFIGNVKRSIHSWFSLMTKFWLVFLVFVPIGIEIRGGWPLTELLYNFLGLRATVNLEWWYIRFYISLLFFFPFLDCFVTYFMEQVGAKKSGCLFLGIFIVCLFNSILRHTVLEGSYFVFMTGYLCAKYNLLDNIIRNKRSRYLSVLLFISIYISKIVIIEIYLGTDHHKFLDFLFVPMFVWVLVQLQNWIPSNLIKLLKLLGKYSAFIWLTHTFFCYYYWPKLVTLPRYSFLVFVWLIAICLGVSMVLDRIHTILYAKIKM